MNDSRQDPGSETPKSMERRRRRGWTHWVAAILIFCAGVVVGAGGMVRVIHQKMVRHYQMPPGHTVELIMRRLDRKLDLRDEQRVRIDAIVQQHLDALGDIRREALPRVKAELSATREEIAAELDADQEARFRRTFGWLEELLPPLPTVRPEDDPSSAVP